MGGEEERCNKMERREIERWRDTKRWREERQQGGEIQKGGEERDSKVERCNKVERGEIARWRYRTRLRREMQKVERRDKARCPPLVGSTSQFLSRCGSEARRWRIIREFLPSCVS